MRNVAEGVRWGLSLREAWDISPRALRDYIAARAQSHRDYFKLLTAAVWKPEAVNQILPPRKLTLAEKRDERNAAMAQKVAAINAVMLARAGAKAQAEDADGGS